MKERPQEQESASTATTTDVIGQKPTEASIPDRWRGIYRKLSALRDQFLGQQRDLKLDAKEERPAFSSHMADAGTDSYDRDWALSMLSTEQNALYEIEQAMSRIQNGTYGICEATGQQIPGERLEAIPWTRFSIETERNLEQNGKVERARLGELRPVARVSVNQAEKEMQKETG